MNPTQLALLAVFASVALLSGSITSLILNRNAAGRRRLREVIETPGKLASTPEVLPLASEEPEGFYQEVSKLLFLRTPKELARLQSRMTRGGIRTPGAAIIYSIAEMILPVVFGVVAYLIHQPAPPVLWLVVIISAAIGYFLPGFWLDSRLAGRRREIENGLPDALDLMVVCIEAGSGVDQAIAKTGDELFFTYPALGEELRTINAEVRAGKTRVDAFKSLAQRTKVDDVRALVAILIQTDRFGTSIGQALRSHADTSRTKRRQRAEESAQKIGVKLVFPLVLFFFPAFYVVVLGPAIIQFVRAFK